MILFGSTSMSHREGTRFDSSVGRGDFNTKIGEGMVIRGIFSFQSMEISMCLTLNRLGRWDSRSWRSRGNVSWREIDVDYHLVKYLA